MIFKIVNCLCSRNKIFKNLYNTSHKFSKIAPSMGNHVDLQEVISVLESFAAKDLSESWDNTGLLVEPYTKRPITNILLTNDLTEDVVLESSELDCELIISYHPPIFAPLKSVTQKSWKERIVSMLLERGTALYSPHTSWDSVRGGVNDWLASCFPLPDSASGEDCGSKPIQPSATVPQFGAGRLLQLSTQLTLADAVERVKKLTGLSHVRVAIPRGGSLQSAVGTVALCAGSGASVLKNVQADLYLTGEMLHHDVLDATQRGVAVILTNHSDSERGFLRQFRDTMRQRLEGRVTLHLSQRDRDPLLTV